MSEFADKVVLVTGACGGMGTAIADAFMRYGARVVAADTQCGERAIADNGGNRLHRLHCDVSERTSVDMCVEQVTSRLGGVDVLINNAAIFPFGSFQSISLDSWRQVFKVNVEGVVNCCQAVIPSMRAKGWGRIVTIGSNTFHMGWENLSHYIASKGAITGLMRALAVELGDSGITANVIAPTLTRTPGTSELFEQAPDVVKSIMSRQAIRRVGLPGDVANAVILLCRQEAGFITGQTLAADGGLAKL